MKKEKTKFNRSIKSLVYGDTMDNNIIRSKKELAEFLEQDAKANYRETVKAYHFNDEIWKFIRCMRYLQYYDYARKNNYLVYLPFIFLRRRYRKLCLKLGFDISWTTEIGKGFSLPHYGSIVINSSTKIGDNFKCHVGVNIGATNGGTGSAVIGNNVYAGPGVKIVGNINIADDVALGAGAVVIKSIDESGTTWGGVPAKKISDGNSHIHLSGLLQLDEK